MIEAYGKVAAVLEDERNALFEGVVVAGDVKGRQANVEDFQVNACLELKDDLFQAVAAEEGVWG